MMETRLKGQQNTEFINIKVTAENKDEWERLSSQTSSSDDKQAK